MLAWLANPFLVWSTTVPPEQGAADETSERTQTPRSFADVTAVLTLAVGDSVRDRERDQELKGTLVMDEHSIRMIPGPSSPVSSSKSHEPLEIDMVDLRSWSFHMTLFFFPNAVELRYTTKPISKPVSDTARATFTESTAESLSSLRITWDQGDVKEIHRTITSLRQQRRRKPTTSSLLERP